MCNSDNWGYSSCCQKERDLKVKHLDAKEIKSHCVRSKEFISDDFCTQDAQVKFLEVEKEVVNDLCAQTLSSKSIFSEKSNTNDLCARSANINSLCVDNLKVNSLDVCNKWRATVAFTATNSYSLGTPINFNSIIDDPNNNIVLGPTRYVVPASGYYMVSLVLNSTNLVGTLPVLGTPTAQIDIVVNGSKRKATFSPFLSFFPSQQATLSTLLTLNAGDQVSSLYEVLVLDPVNGLSNYAGTVDFIGGNPSSGLVSSMQIIYLSSLCQPTTPVTCVQCPLVEVPCSPVEVPCEPMGHRCEKPEEGEVVARLKESPVKAAGCPAKDGSCPTGSVSTLDMRRSRLKTS